MSCNICCDNYNRSNRSKIVCPYCDFEVCRSCCETYILSETIPRCMKPECAKEWSANFLRNNFTYVFLSTKYKKHREDILFDQEKSLMPATQPLIEEKIRKKHVLCEIAMVDSQIQKLYIKKRELEATLYKKSGDIKQSYKYVRQCPANDCRGFLSSQWKCGICEKWTCPTCHELKGYSRDCEHVCDTNSVETAKLLEKDSKPCPKCQSLIFKIDGCNQMWCTQCHVAFDWVSGRIEQNIHNPHYYEWMRKNNNGEIPRNPNDNMCDRVINQYLADNITVHARKHAELYSDKDKYLSGRPKFVYSKEITQVVQIIQQVIHNQYTVLPNYQTDYLLINQDLRVSYLENSMSEDEFKKKIQQNDNRNRKNVEISQVLELVYTALCDILHRLKYDLQTKENLKLSDVQEYLNECNEIGDYCNNIFKNIAFTYKTNSILAFTYIFHVIKIPNRPETKTKEETKEEKT